MGNCAASKLRGGGEEEAVFLCHERKRHIESAVLCRRALADAHNRYIHSLHAVAGAINLFVGRHSAPLPALITLPSSGASSSSSNPSFLQQTPTAPVTETLAYCSSVSSSTSSAPTSLLRDGIEVAGESGSGYFLPEAPATFGWDFFNPFERMNAAATPAGQNSEEELKMEVTASVTAVKEEVKKAPERGLSQRDPPEKKMELLYALSNVEEEFIKAYESGKELSRMLESKLFIPCAIDQTKEKSSKLIKAITWHKSSSSLSSSSSTNYWGSSSKGSLLTASGGELFDDYGGMGSGSHSQTLGRLYAWEKKLYEEVKAEESTRQMYQEKCLQLRNLGIEELSSRKIEKARVAAKDLYARISVALRTIQTISIRIQKVRDEELQPQLIELLQGLTRSWRTMLKSHERQKQIMLDVNAFTCPSYGRYCSDSQRQVTKNLEKQLENWLDCFKSYVTAQRAYAESLQGWVSKFAKPHIKYYSRKDGSTPLLLILQDWSSSSMNLPDKAVSISMAGLIKNTKFLMAKQAEEMQRKRKVDGLAEELKQKIELLHKTDSRILEPEVQNQKDLVEMCRQKLEAEKAKHRNCMRETTDVTLNGFKVGLTNVFEKMTEFSRDSLHLYEEILARNEGEGEAGDDEREKSSSMEDSNAQLNNR
ncbi:hypothetical protein KSP40_PGU012293 [Platanthera guangdongensis]|uniref:Nitrate regulatory gene2 protein n=1 Tax=Platanthera guangdongensis TaxID=2320717 RepID=A0ABR2MDQ0_9ASPA